MDSHHANLRAQQRCIPPFIDYLLDAYGQEQHDGHGALLVFFDKRSFRAMERDMGRQPVRKFTEWRNAYKVVSASDGGLITLGHRTKRIHRQ